MKKLKLTLHPEKTRVVDMYRDGFDFLGFYFLKGRSMTSGKTTPYSMPSKKAVKNVRLKIREITDRRMYLLNPGIIIARLNLVIRGWRNYFKTGNSTRKFQQLDGYLEYRMFRFMKKQGGNRHRLPREKFKNWYFTYSGIERFYIPGETGFRP
jgi:hypothetical protein